MGKSQEILLSCNTAFVDFFVMYLTCFYNQNPGFVKYANINLFFSDTKKSEKQIKQLVTFRRIKYVEIQFLFYL